jgi:hypothetical protein
MIKTAIFITAISLFIAGCKKNDSNPVANDNTNPSSWSRTFKLSDHDWGCNVQQVTDGGYAVFGMTMRSGSPDFLLFKTNTKGDSLWYRQYGGSGDEIPASLQKTSDGGLILCGYTSSFGAGATDGWLVKVDSQGTELWAHPYGDIDQDNFEYVDQTLDGGFIASGYTNVKVGDFSVISKAWLVKTDRLGIKQWEKSYLYDSTSSGTAGCVTQTPDGGFLLTVIFHSGMSEDFDITKNIWLVKTNSTGDTTWTKLFRLPDHGYSVTLKSSGDGGYVILATSFMKIDAAGNIQWTRDIRGAALARTSDGGYITLPDPMSFKESDQLVKTDQNGNLLWSRDMIGEHVEQTTDGGYIITGSEVSGTRGETALTLIKTDKDGNVK